MSEISRTENINNLDLQDLFGTDDILSIIGIKSQDELTSDRILVQQNYLRSVMRNHPNSSGLDPETLEAIKETIVRSKKLYVMNDIFKFLTNDDDDKVRKLRNEYFQNRIVPDLPSIKYLRNNPFNLNSGIYKVPQFEEVAAELRSVFQARMKAIQEMQKEMTSSSS